LYFGLEITVFNIYRSFLQSGEKKFSSVDELSAQIRRDVEVAREVLARAAKKQIMSCEEKFNR